MEMGKKRRRRKEEKKKRRKEERRKEEEKKKEEQERRRKAHQDIRRLQIHVGSAHKMEEANSFGYFHSDLDPVMQSNVAEKV